MMIPMERNESYLANEGRSRVLEGLTGRDLSGGLEHDAEVLVALRHCEGSERVRGVNKISEQMDENHKVNV